jgi:hypothetical protein
MRVPQAVDRDRLQPGKLSVIPEVLRKSGLRAFEDPFVRIIVIQKRQILLELITKEIRILTFLTELSVFGVLTISFPWCCENVLLTRIVLVSNQYRFL